MPEMPQQAPQPGAEAPAEGGNQLTELIGNISSGLTMLLDVVGSSGNQEAAQGLDQVSQQFQQIMESVMAGGAQGAPQGQGISSPEAGGAAGAVPASMARR